MINNKRGLSTVVTTLIIILLVFIAVGIIWVVIRNVIQGGTENVDWSSKCLEVSVESTKLTCTSATNPAVNPDVCTVSMVREAGGEAIAGVKVVLSGTGGNFVSPQVGNIVPLATKTTPAITATGITNVTGVEIVPYFLDGQNVEHLC